MENTKVQQVWTKATTALICGRCKAARLMVWEKTKGADHPQQACAIDDHWVAVHCDYFKRRIESPEQLLRCGAFQKRDEKHDSAAASKA